MDPRLKHPLTCIIAGPTGSGKSYFVRRLLAHKEEMMKPVPEHIVWYYGEWQPIYATMRDVEFVEGLPNIETLNPEKKHLVIIDDMMSEMDERVTFLFT